MAATRRDQLTFPISVRELEVVAVTDLGPGMRRITLGGDQLGPFRTEDGIAVPGLRNEGFDDHVKVLVPAPGRDRPALPKQVEGHLDWAAAEERPIAKDYTPRRWDPEAGELDLDFVRHGTGPAASWAERVQVGDPAWIAGPKSSALLPHDVDWLLIGGDETALPAIGRLLDDLPADARAQVFIEVADAEHELPLRELPGVRVTWLHRDGAAAGTTGLLAAAIEDIDWWPGRVYAWLAGEAGTLKPLRRHLKLDREVPKDCLEVTGYWRRTDAAEAAVDEHEHLHERLHEVAELTAPLALRTAVTLGLLEALEGGTLDTAELAGRSGADPQGLAALLRVLEHEGLVAAEPDGRWSLAPLGAELVGDGHSLEQYHLDGPQAWFEFSLVGMREHLTGSTARSQPPKQLAGPLRAMTEDQALWYAPSIAEHHDWSGYHHLAAIGSGAARTLAAVLRDRPGLTGELIGLPSELTAVAEVVAAGDLGGRIRTVSSPAASLPPGRRDAVLAVNLLDRSRADDAIAQLQAVTRQLDGAELVLAEPFLDLSGDAMVTSMILDTELTRWCTFGVGYRTLEEWAEIIAAAGLAVEGEAALGWGMHLWRLRPA